MFAPGGLWGVRVRVTSQLQRHNSPQGAVGGGGPGPCTRTPLPRVPNPTQPEEVDNQPPIHVRRIPVLKDEHVRTPGSLNRRSSSALIS